MSRVLLVVILGVLLLLPTAADAAGSSDVVISQASGHFVTEVWIPLSGSPAGGA